jgi:osmotically-inducible protein OsmY
MDQSNASKDIDQVAQVRRAVLDIDSLSSNGKNVKIITGNGQVILRGPVDSQSEKDAIEQAARSVAGTATIINELEVETD